MCINGSNRKNEVCFDMATADILSTPKKVRTPYCFIRKNIYANFHRTKGKEVSTQHIWCFVDLQLNQ